MWVSWNKLYACKYNSSTQKLEYIWQKSIWENSGATTMTAFDFDRDGFTEIVYRDETNLKIINGTTGNELATYTCNSPTTIEYPVIVDLNKDGQAEILVSECSSTSSYAGQAKIMALKSSTDFKWASTRSVWNQYAYNVIHVNNNLTIPQYQFNSVTVFMNPDKPGILRLPFNGFLQQVSMIDENGEPVSIYDIDAFFREDSTQIISANCDSINIKICISNLGIDTLQAPFFISFYRNFYKGGLIKTISCQQSISTDQDACITFKLTDKELQDFMPMQNLVIAVNDGGHGVAQHGFQQPECDTLNNFLKIPFSSYHFNYEKEFNETVCPGKEYELHGFTIPIDTTIKPGDYEFIHEFTSVGGCDSIIKLQLKVMTYADTAKIFDTICNGNTYTLNGFNIPKQDIDGNYNFFTTSMSHMGCDSVIDLTLTVITPTISIKSDDSILCGSQLNLQVLSSLKNVLWDVGIKDENVAIKRPGTYGVTVSSGQCSIKDSITIKSCCPKFELIPNVVSVSNRDGINDYFGLPEIFTFFQLEINIYNRYGKRVFYSNDPNFKWYANDVSSGTYYFIIQLDKSCEYIGVITVL